MPSLKPNHNAARAGPTPRPIDQGRKAHGPSPSARERPDDQEPANAADEADAPEASGEGGDSPILDLSDAAVKRMIKLAKARGYVTLDELNAVLPSDETSPEQIEDIMAMLNEMGINVVESEEETENLAAKVEAEAEGESTETALIKVEAAKTPADRTDDPVRMYLREMGQVELLSREGEIAIAKRIEAGREAMIAGLCESPLTFQAIIIWRDELNEAKILLRDIIDLEATYAGPDAKKQGPVQTPAPYVPPKEEVKKKAEAKRAEAKRVASARRPDDEFGDVLSRRISTSRQRSRRMTRTRVMISACRSPRWKRS